MDLQTTLRRATALQGPGAPPAAKPNVATSWWAALLQRLVARWVKLGAVCLAAMLMVACGGGGEEVAGAAGSRESRAAAIAASPQSLELKVLVISAEGVASRPSYLAITSVLDQIGLPYDKIVLKGIHATALQLVPGTLDDGAGNGKYQGVILETGDLAYEQSPGYFPRDRKSVV